MATEIQDGLLKSMSIVMDAKIKEIPYNYYFNATIIDSNTRQTDNALVYTVASNPIYCPQSSNRFINSKLYEDEIRLIRNNGDVIGYYGVVYSGVRARAGLFCSIGDNVSVLVKNGELSEKIIDDCSAYNAGTSLKTVSQVGGSLFASLPLTLTCEVKNSNNNVPYGQVNFSWNKITDTQDPYHTLGGFSLIICQGSFAPCIFKDATFNYGADVTSCSITDTYNVIEQGKTYTAFLVAKDLYGNYIQSLSSNALKTFTLPLKPDTPIIPSNYPSWYTTEYTNGYTDENAEGLSSFNITDNFAYNNKLVEIPNGQFKTAIIKASFDYNSSCEYFGVFGIEYDTPDINWGTLWKNPNYNQSFIYIHEGSYPEPDVNTVIPEDVESDEYFACIKRFEANYYGKIDALDSRNVIDDNYDSFGRAESTDPVYSSAKEHLDSSYMHIVSRIFVSLPYYRDINSSPKSWQPYDEQRMIYGVPPSMEGTCIRNYGIVLGMDANGNHNPHKCFAFVYEMYDVDADDNVIPFDVNGVNSRYNQTFTMSYYESHYKE